jgi:hypothetical protein
MEERIQIRMQETFCKVKGTHSKEQKVEKIQRPGSEWQLGVFFVNSVLLLVVNQHSRIRGRCEKLINESVRYLSREFFA